MLKLKIMITLTFQLSVGHAKCRITGDQPLDEGLSLMMLVFYKLPEILLDPDGE